MRFLADMGVSIGVVEWLRKNGHDARHLREEGLHWMPNGEIFTKAIREDRIIITFDLDFGEIVALSKGKRTSVIIFRLHNTRTPHLLHRLSAPGRHRCGVRGPEPPNSGDAHQCGPAVESVASGAAAWPDQAFRPGSKYGGHAQSRLSRNPGREDLSSLVAANEG